MRTYLSYFFATAFQRNVCAFLFFTLTAVHVAFSWSTLGHSRQLGSCRRCVVCCVFCGAGYHRCCCKNGRVFVHRVRHHQTANVSISSIILQLAAFLRPLYCISKMYNCRLYILAVSILIYNYMWYTTSYKNCYLLHVELHAKYVYEGMFVT